MEIENPLVVYFIAQVAMEIKSECEELRISCGLTIYLDEFVCQSNFSALARTSRWWA